jgi:hypothetical protein
MIHNAQVIDATQLTEEQLMQVIFLNSWLYSAACLTMKNQ